RKGKLRGFAVVQVVRVRVALHLNAFTGYDQRLARRLPQRHEGFHARMTFHDGDVIGGFFACFFQGRLKAASVATPATTLTVLVLVTDEEKAALQSNTPGAFLVDIQVKAVTQLSLRQVFRATRSAVRFGDHQAINRERALGKKQVVGNAAVEGDIGGL